MNTKTNKEEKQLTPVEAKPEITKINIESLISKAIDKNIPVDVMERLLVIRRELKAEWAKEQYDKAMSEFQAECPIIKKTKGVRTDEGKVAYKYAPLEAIVDQVKILLSKHGFSYGVNQPESKQQGYIKVAFTVKHKSGHSEVSSVELPLGNKTKIMSQTQVEAAALTFAKRYAFCNAFGILTGDEDNEVNSISDDKPLTTRQMAEEKEKQQTNDTRVCSAHDKPVQMLRGVSKSKMDANGNPKIYWWHKDAKGDICFGNGSSKSQAKVSSTACEFCHAPTGKPHASNCPVVKELEVDPEEAERGIKEMNDQRASS
jgi:cytochrome c553